MEIDEPEKLKPSQTIFKFKDMTTAIQFREDGNILAVGEKQGNIQIFELNNKVSLRTYKEHKK